jgi:hypothetical protein
VVTGIYKRIWEVLVRGSEDEFIKVNFLSLQAEAGSKKQNGEEGFHRDGFSDV